MRTRHQALRNRELGDLKQDAEESQEGTQSTLARGESGMVGRLRNHLRTKFTLEADRRDASFSQQDTNEFNNELHRLRRQNLQLKRGRRSPVKPDTAPCFSTDTLFSRMTPSEGSARSCPLSSDHAAPLPSTSRADSPSFTHPLNTLSLLPKPRRLNVLETLVRAFPITIPTEEFVNFVDTKGHPELTDDMKRYFMERKNEHRTEFERCISVFKSERPWEPKWFTNFLGKLLASTKARPSVYQYMFDMRARREESRVLQRWRKLSIFLKWTIFVVSLLIYFVMICFLIEMYGDEGVNMAVPITLFLTIVLNKLLVNMNSTLPAGI